MTTNLYVPDEVTEPRAAVIFVCGHYNEAKSHPEYQTVCQYLVHTGLIVLAVDPIGQGERSSYYEKSLGREAVRPGTMDHNYAGFMCLLLRQSIGRYFLHDIMRSIDYLYSRPEVDKDKIGITGNSGGGVQSGLAMICEPRISAAAPANFITNRRTYMYVDQTQDMEQIFPGMSAIGFDHEDIVMIMAPKPVLILASAYDFFPIEGTRATFKRVKRFWEFCGKSENIELFETKDRHCYNREMAKKAAEFFSLHFLGKCADIKDDRIKLFDIRDLTCTKSGQVRGDMDDARFVYEDNCDSLSVLERTRMDVPEEERKQRALEWLRSIIVENRVKCDLNPRHKLNVWVDELLCSGSYWWSQEGIFNHCLIFRHQQYKDEVLPVVIAIWENGTADLQSHSEWIRRQCRSGKAVAVLDVTGVGMVYANTRVANQNCDEYGDYNKPSSDLFFLDDSMAAIRVYDVMRAVDFLQEIHGIDHNDISVFAFGRHGVYGEIAAFLDNRIKKVEVVGGIGSFGTLLSTRYYDLYDVISLIIPGVLKYLDLPDLRAWKRELYVLRSSVE